MSESRLPHLPLNTTNIVGCYAHLASWGLVRQNRPDLLARFSCWFLWLLNGVGRLKVKVETAKKPLTAERCRHPWKVMKTPQVAAMAGMTPLGMKPSEPQLEMLERREEWQGNATSEATPIDEKWDSKGTLIFTADGKHVIASTNPHRYALGGEARPNAERRAREIVALHNALVDGKTDWRAAVDAAATSKGGES